MSDTHLKSRIVEMGSMGFKDVAEIAEVLGCSVPIVKQTLNRAGLRPYVRYAMRNSLKTAEAEAIHRGIARRQAEIKRLERRLQELR